MSFGRRLALFFLLIALVPTAALIGILLFISQDSQRGKADARLAAGLQTAVGVYSRRSEVAQSEARKLAKDPELAAAMASSDRAQLEEFARRASHEPRVVRVELADRGDEELAAAGPVDAVAFADVTLTEGGAPAGTLSLSSTTADQYVATVRRLTEEDLVLTREGEVLASTVTDPPTGIEQDATEDVTVDGRDLRAHALEINSQAGEELVIIGERKEGGVLGLGRPATGILIWFLIAAVVLAYILARALTRLHDRVAEQAVTDPLTGLWNRRYMGETMEREVARALRFKHEISLIILDVDDFKQINDRQGHLQGDIVLETVADIVIEATRSIDVASRYGGDELAVILVETGREGAQILAERLRENAAKTKIPIRDGDGEMSVTLSVGVATIPDSASDLESLVDSADRALLRAKRAGKDQIRVAPVA